MPRDRFRSIAIERFEEFGCESSGTSDSAQVAETAMYSISYHFGGKEGLHLACAEHIADHVAAVHAVGLGMIRERPLKTAKQAWEALLLLTKFARVTLAPQSAACSQFIVREPQPTEVFKRIYVRVIGPLIETAVGIIPIARASLDHEARRVWIIKLVGMALVMRLGHACVSHAMKLDDLTEDSAEFLIACLRRSAHALLTGA